MKEEDIRPKSIFDEYLALTEADTDTYFGNCYREAINCPACGGVGTFAFQKSGFDYEECSACQTLFVSPRPVESAFSRYYTEAPSVNFWATTFYRETADARRDLLWKPKAKLVQSIVERWIDVEENYSIVDIGGGYGIFSEEIEKLTKKKAVVIEPSPMLARVCREKKLTVVEKFLESVVSSDLPDGKKVFVSFELFEHLHSPEKFLESLYSVMSSGDVFILTTLSGTGVDIRVLWENSRSVSPPHHLNFLNPKSIRILFAECGFNILDISTPGELDIDIMQNDRLLIKDRFWQSFLDRASDIEKQSMQRALQETCSSSHIMVVSQKD